MTVLNNETAQEIPNRKKGAGQRRNSEGNPLRRAHCKAVSGSLPVLPAPSSIQGHFQMARHLHIDSKTYPQETIYSE